MFRVPVIRPRRLSRRAPALASLMVALTAVLGLATPAATLAWSPSTFSADSEQQLYALTNDARAAAGMKALRWDPALASIARWRSEDMIDRDFFSHTIPPSGEMVWDVMDQRGYCYNVAGENIGWNLNWPDDQATIQVEDAFLGSSTHRSNILGVAWDSIGIGAYKGADGKIMWTVLFADRCGTVTPPSTSGTSASGSGSGSSSTFGSAAAGAVNGAEVAPPGSSLAHDSGTRVVPLVAGTNNVVRLQFTFDPSLAGRHVQILRATRVCAPGGGTIRCGSGATYGTWSPFTMLTGRVIAADGTVEVALSTRQAQWLSLVASLPADLLTPGRSTPSQQVRWR